MSKSELEDYLLAEFKVKGWSPRRNYRFYPFRMWKADFAWVRKKVIVEVEGGTWSGGRHTSGAGFEKDCEKYNTATSSGWQVYRFTSSMIKSGYAIKFMVGVFDPKRRDDDLRLKDSKRRKRNSRKVPGGRSKGKKPVQ